MKPFSTPMQIRQRLSVGLEVELVSFRQSWFYICPRPWCRFLTPQFVSSDFCGAYLTVIHKTCFRHCCLLQLRACANDSLLHNSADSLFWICFFVFVCSSCHDRGWGRGWHPSLWEENCHWLLLSPGQVQTAFQWFKVSPLLSFWVFAVYLWSCLPSRLLSGVQSCSDLLYTYSQLNLLSFLFFFVLSFFFFSFLYFFLFSFFSFFLSFSFFLFLSFFFFFLFSTCLSMFCCILYLFFFFSFLLLF